MSGNIVRHPVISSSSLTILNPTVLQTTEQKKKKLVNEVPTL